MFLRQRAAEVQGGTGQISIYSHSRCGLSWLPPVSLLRVLLHEPLLGVFVFLLRDDALLVILLQVLQLLTQRLIARGLERGPASATSGQHCEAARQDGRKARHLECFH